MADLAKQMSGFALPNLTRRGLGFSETRRVFSCLVVAAAGLLWTIALATLEPKIAGGQELSGQVERRGDQANGGVFEDPQREASRQRWAEEVSKLRALDELESYPDDAVLFFGSSSIRLWDTIAEDMAPMVPIRRGFGGAKSLDLAVFAPELIPSHRYSALVVFVANDIAGEEGKTDQNPDDVRNRLKEVWEVSRKHQPQAPLLLLEITPTDRRRHVWDQQRALNHCLRDWTLTEPNVYFLPTAEYFLDAEDQVRSEFFGEDRLHLSRAGYRQWGTLIRRRLQELRGDESPHVAQ